MDLDQIIRRFFRFLILLGAIVFSLIYIPSNKLTGKEIIMITTVISIVFIIMDMYYPSYFF